jgi:hypothetical protein
MSEEIKVGDLVYVATTCCSGTASESLGLIGAVEELELPRYFSCTRCTYCLTTFSGLHAYLNCSSAYSKAPIGWLRKIPPLTELNKVEREEEIPA